MKMNIIRNLILFVLTAMSVACTQEDTSMCGVDVLFKYDYNMDEEDKFHTDIDRIDLFVFDEDGIFMGAFVSEGPFDTDFRMQLQLPAGTYSLVAWGGYRDDQYSIPTLFEGVSRLDEAWLRFINHSADGSVETFPSHLFYGSRMEVETKALGSEILISMIKNTNSITTVFKELPISPEREDNFVIRIEAVNRNYTFENKLWGEDRLNYIPNVTVSSTELLRTGEFGTMRVLGAAYDTPCQSRIILEYHPDRNPGSRAESEVVTIMDAYLAEVIERQYNRVIDYDKQDEFHLEFIYDGDNDFSNYTITVNGWTAARGSGSGVIW